MRDNIGLARQPETPYMPPAASNYEEFFNAERRGLEARLKEIDRSLETLRDERATVEARLERLDQARRLLEAAPSAVRSEPKMTIKQGVLKVLEQAPNGLTAISILERLRVELGLDYERTSLSPQLSRLRQEGKISLSGGVWSLRK